MGLRPFHCHAGGKVRDPVVAASAPEGYFEEAALASVRRYTYRPSDREFPDQFILLSFDAPRE
jgi:hypothetical protein